MSKSGLSWTRVAMPLGLRILTHDETIGTYEAAGGPTHMTGSDERWRKSSRGLRQASTHSELIYQAYWRIVQQIIDFSFWVDIWTRWVYLYGHLFPYGTNFASRNRHKEAGHEGKAVT